MRRRAGRMALSDRIALGVTLILAALGLATSTARGDDMATRVVTLGGSITEIVFALGEGDRLVARDSTSSFPAEALDLPDVGYLRALSPEGVLSAQPDLIISEKGAGPPDAVALLTSAAIPFVKVPEARTADQIARKIVAVGEALGVRDKAQVLAAEVVSDLQATAEHIASADQPRPRVLFILSTQGGRLLASGVETSADAIIDLAGGENAIDSFEGYKAVTAEAIAQAAPEVILMMDRAGDHASSDADLFQMPALRTTPAAQQHSVVRMDGLLLLGFGPRTAEAVRILHGVLALVLLAVAIASLATGASGTSLWRALWGLVMGEGPSATEAVILWNIRAPRTLLGACVGAALAVSGAVMQGLFRNPLADPGLLGVSAGAGLGALLAIVVGTALPLGLAAILGGALLPVLAFVGAWASMMVLYAFATRSGRTSVATMLLAGIALAALTGAISGLLIFHANDLQLRELTFWQLGSLSGSTWAKVVVAGPVILLATCVATRLARGLDGLALGEASAHHIGVNVQRTKNVAILSVSAASGAAVAVSGGIGFVGIVVPHLLRLATGPDHRGLLINSALLGASLLLMADIISRAVVAPAELPIGIVTAVLGAPFFFVDFAQAPWRRGLVE